MTKEMHFRESRYLPLDHSHPGVMSSQDFGPPPGSFARSPLFKGMFDS